MWNTIGFPVLRGNPFVSLVYVLASKLASLFWTRSHSLKGERRETEKLGEKKWSKKKQRISAPCLCEETDCWDYGNCEDV